VRLVKKGTIGTAWTTGSYVDKAIDALNMMPDAILFGVTPDVIGALENIRDGYWMLHEIDGSTPIHKVVRLVGTVYSPNTRKGGRRKT